MSRHGGYYMQAVIMVGGMGVRLRPFTYSIPKPLLPIGNITILESIVQSLCENGFDELFLMTSYQSHKFDQCIGYEKKYGIKLNVCREKTKMGTVGGISLLKGQLNNDFLVLNGDLVVDVDFLSMFNYHLKNKADITVGTTKYDYTLPYGVVESNNDDELIRIVEKPTQSFNINSGIYVLNSSVLHLQGSASYMDMPTLMHLAQSKNKKIVTYDIGEKWLDTGLIENYETALDTIEKWNRDSGLEN